MFENMFLNNQWLFIHMLYGMVVGKVFFYLKVRLGAILVIVLTTSVIWECGEFLFKNWQKIYGSLGAALADSTGDILGAVFSCFMVLL